MLCDIRLLHRVVCDARAFSILSLLERWGAGVETQKNVRGEVGDGVEYHLMSPTPRRSVPFTTGRRAH